MQSNAMSDPMADFRVRCEAAQKNWTKADGLTKTKASLRDISDQMRKMQSENRITAVLQTMAIQKFLTQTNGKLTDRVVRAMAEWVEYVEQQNASPVTPKATPCRCRTRQFAFQSAEHCATPPPQSPIGAATVTADTSADMPCPPPPRKN